MSSEVHLWMPMLLTTPIFVSQFAVSLLRWDISERSCWVKTSWGGMIVSHQVVDKKKRNETVRNWFRLRFFLEVDSYPMAGYVKNWQRYAGWVFSYVSYVCWDPHPLAGSLSLISVLGGRSCSGGGATLEDCRKVLENESREPIYGTPWDDDIFRKIACDNLLPSTWWLEDSVFFLNRSSFSRIITWKSLATGQSLSQDHRVLDEKFQIIVLLQREKKGAVRLRFQGKFLQNALQNAENLFLLGAKKVTNTTGEEQKIPFVVWASKLKQRKSSTWKK